MIFGFALGTGLRELEILAFAIGDVFHSDGTTPRDVAMRVFNRATEDSSHRAVGGRS